MSKLKELLYKSFVLSLKRKWLKEIDKELKKYEKLKRKSESIYRYAELHLKVSKELMEEYDKRFHSEVNNNDKGEA